MKYFFLILGLVCGLATASALPPSPQHYFNDYAGLVSQEKADTLNAKLVDLETRTSTQFVVAVFPTFTEDTSIEDFTQRTTESWGVGQKDKNNGVVLFIFVKDNNGKTTTRLEVGYGLEGVLPDATAKSIIDDQIRPHIRAAKAGGGQAEWEAALTAGVNATIAAVQNEYQIPSDASGSSEGLPWWGILLIIIVILVIVIVLAETIKYPIRPTPITPPKRLASAVESYVPPVTRRETPVPRPKPKRVETRRTDDTSSSAPSFTSSYDSGSSYSSGGDSGGSGGFSGGGGDCGGGGASGSD